MVVDLIQNLAAPIHTVLTHLLAVLDPFGPVGRHLPAPLRAGFRAFGAGIARLDSILHSPLRPTALGPSALQELSRCAAGRPRPDGRRHACGPRPRAGPANNPRGRLGHVEEIG